LSSRLIAAVLPVLIFILHELQLHQLKQQGSYYKAASTYLKAI